MSNFLQRKKSVFFSDRVTSQSSNLLFSCRLHDITADITTL